MSRQSNWSNFQNQYAEERKMSFKKKQKNKTYYSYVGRHCRRGEFKLKLQMQYQIYTRISSSCHRSWAKDFGFEPSLYKEKKINNNLWTWMLYCQILFFHLVQPPYNYKLWKSWLKGTEIPVYWCTGLRTAVSAGGIFGTYGSLGFEMSCLKIMSGLLRISHQKSTFKGNSPGIRKFLSRNSIIKLVWTLPEI